MAFEDVSSAAASALDYHREHGTWEGFDAMPGFIPSDGSDTEGPGVSVMTSSDGEVAVVAQDLSGAYACLTIRSDPWWQGYGEGSGYPDDASDCEGEPHPDKDLDVARGDLLNGQMVTIRYGREHRGFEGLGQAANSGTVDTPDWPARWSLPGSDVTPHHVAVVEESQHEATIAVMTDDGRFVCLTIRRVLPGFKHFGQGVGFPASTADCLAAGPQE